MRNVDDRIEAVAGLLGPWLLARGGRGRADRPPGGREPAGRADRRRPDGGRWNGVRQGGGNDPYAVDVANDESETRGTKRRSDVIDPAPTPVESEEHIRAAREDSVEPATGQRSDSSVLCLRYRTRVASKWG